MVCRYSRGQSPHKNVTFIDFLMNEWNLSYETKLTGTVWFDQQPPLFTLGKQWSVSFAFNNTQIISGEVPSAHVICIAITFSYLCRKLPCQAQRFQCPQTHKRRGDSVKVSYRFIRKVPTPHPSKLLEFYLPQAYDLQPKTLCKESKD